MPAGIAGVERYVIRGGKEGHERLLLLSRERWPSTAALFARAGLAPGMRCIDLGCAGGEVTMEIAGWSSPGAVTGVDMDKIKLDLARQETAARGLSNVEFRLLDVGDWDEPGGYDVYCRFLLQHLSQPVGLLRRMWAGVRPGVFSSPRTPISMGGAVIRPTTGPTSSCAPTVRCSSGAAGITRRADLPAGPPGRLPPRRGQRAGAWRQRLRHRRRRSRRVHPRERLHPTPGHPGLPLPVRAPAG